MKYLRRLYLSKCVVLNRVGIGNFARSGHEKMSRIQPKIRNLIYYFCFHCYAPVLNNLSMHIYKSNKITEKRFTFKFIMEKLWCIYTPAVLALKTNYGLVNPWIFIIHSSINMNKTINISGWEQCNKDNKVLFKGILCNLGSQVQPFPFKPDRFLRCICCKILHKKLVLSEEVSHTKCYFLVTNWNRHTLFLSMGDRTRNLVSLHIRLVPLPYEPFQHLQNRCEITHGAVAQCLYTICWTPIIFFVSIRGEIHTL